MVIYLGADHRGLRVKEAVKRALQSQGYEVVDCGANQLDPADDYVDFARAVATHVSRDPAAGRGIVICGSGMGADVAANKVAHVRSVLAFANDQVVAARHDDDANILALAADFTDEAAALHYVTLFLETPFGGDERYCRRIEKIAAIEREERAAQ